MTVGRSWLSMTRHHEVEVSCYSEAAVAPSPCEMCDPLTPA